MLDNNPDEYGQIYHMNQLKTGGTTKTTQSTTKAYPYPDSKVNGANMGPIWGRQDPGGRNVGPMNFAIWVFNKTSCIHVWLTDNYLYLNDGIAFDRFFKVTWRIQQKWSFTRVGKSQRII